MKFKTDWKTYKDALENPGQKQYGIYKQRFGYFIYDKDDPHIYFWYKYGEDEDDFYILDLEGKRIQ